MCRNKVVGRSQTSRSISGFRQRIWISSHHQDEFCLRITTLPADAWFAARLLPKFFLFDSLAILEPNYSNKAENFRSFIIWNLLIHTNFSRFKASLLFNTIRLNSLGKQKTKKKVQVWSPAQFQIFMYMHIWMLKGWKRIFYSSNLIANWATWIARFGKVAASYKPSIFATFKIHEKRYFYVRLM